MRQMINDAAIKLREAGIDDPRHEAELLMAYALEVSMASLWTQSRTPSDEIKRRFEGDIHRRSSRFPIQYLLRKAPFFDMELAILPGILIPRPETEVLVDHAVAWATAYQKEHAHPIRAADIGTGSGCIAIACARRLPSMRTLATDISDAALKTARENAVRYDVGDLIHFVHGDLVEPLRAQNEKFDMVLSNPPYIAEEDRAGLQPEVQYEPPEALYAQEHGMYYHRVLLAEVRHVLGTGGAILLEVGYNQASHVAEMAARYGYTDVRIMKDLAGIERIVIAIGGKSI